MTLSFNRNVVRWIIIISSFIIISLILWNTYIFFQNFKAEERSKMRNWSFAQKEISITKNLNDDFGELPLEIITSNTTTPMIKVNDDGSIDYNNIDEEKAKDSLYLVGLIEKFKKENRPIEIKYKNKVLSMLYYGNSPLLNKLKYYPLALLLIIILFAAVVYFFYRSAKTADQNKLWTGMAKETAHQIGTPLSSLVGWTEILKTEQVNPDYIQEIEKDIDRLKTITERFSKIGSAPTLEKMDIVEATIDSYDYLKSRSSKLINFEIIIPEHQIFVDLNEQLYSWTIENLVKNAIDAMKGKGDLKVELFQVEKQVFIKITDTGKGIHKNQFTKIFEPGFTTKKRGWGLGLSLAKRIIEDYHNGKIKVLESEIGKGTTIQITLKVLS
ncbi:MAG: two-component sensor histidine kinase [Flavobacteriaceae bacterium]|uniref:sensor histidine kinase n=1 Tax=Winogradskyella sp. SYSU M77433 TaxID=3042722 RepID=UPI000C6418C6|nr:HAMP domain-containing sensor histidine kinase [Winogradskyella sp. SYSU M77433]MAX70905.1 two-component sensor histidine kinase [Flavobacteriaceae bacterium]MDH7912163.1 HAMP domain-containing sensor histidine kinase [Winogradskyella sp. SYSU M77433]